MQRRGLLAGLGALATGGAVAVGTGAFTNTTAARSISVNVADEDQAYLGIDELDGTTYENATFASQATANQLTIDINDEFGTDDSSDGVGLDSIYEFDNVFQIENQGTQSVDVEITSLSNSDFNPDVSGLTVEFYPGSQADRPLDGNPITLTTGKSRRIGLKIETEEPAIDDFSVDATVSANST